jgi:hypothetical protein
MASGVFLFVLRLIEVAEFSPSGVGEVKRRISAIARLATAFAWEGETNSHPTT